MCKTSFQTIRKDPTIVRVRPMMCWTNIIVAKLHMLTVFWWCCYDCVYHVVWYLDRIRGSNVVVPIESLPRYLTNKSLLYLFQFGHHLNVKLWPPLPQGVKSGKKCWPAHSYSILTSHHSTQRCWQTAMKIVCLLTLFATAYLVLEICCCII